MSDPMGHDDYLELLAGAALDDLDPTEMARLTAHQGGCPICTEAAQGLDTTLVALAMAVPQRRPTAALEARIMAAVAAEPHATRATTVDPEVATRPAAPVVPPDGGTRWPAWLRRPQFALAATAIALVLGVTTVGLALQAQNLRSTVATQDAAIAVLADPNHVIAPLEPEDGATGVSAMAVFLPDSTESYVMATGLAATPTGKVYQLWSADEAGVHPLGTYTFDGNGSFVAPFGVDLSSAAAAMITLEPTGGSTGEPGPQVVFGELPTSES